MSARETASHIVGAIEPCRYWLGLLPEPSEIRQHTGRPLLMGRTREGSPAKRRRKMKVVLYARVSPHKQAEKDLSISAQLRALRGFAHE